MRADVLIAGGGPAGAALAILAGRAGLSVALFESHHFPRDKPCGEGLMPAGVGALARLGVDAAHAGSRFAGIRYHGFGLVAEARFPAPARAIADGGPAPHGLGQRRTVLDQALLAVARATPHVQVHEDAPVDGVVWRAGRVTGLRIGDRAIGGRLVVGADGARSVVRHALGLDGARARRPRWGARMHFRLAAGRAVPDVVEIFVGDDHELYLTPLPDGEVLVAMLTAHARAHGPGPAPEQRSDHLPNDERAPGNERATLLELVARHPILADRLQGATPVSRLMGRSPLAARASAGFVPGAVLIGDAAGFTDPITGGGMAQALLSAELLAARLPRILAEGDTEQLWRFDRSRRVMLRDYLLLTRAMVGIARRPFLARAMLRAMRAKPKVMRHLVGVAAGLRRLVPGPRPEA